MLDSLQRQDHQDWECLIVDDGSRDATASIVRLRAKDDCRIKLVSSGEKLGKAAAFNLAFAASVGECVVLLAGDDRLPDKSLSIRAGDMATAAANERLLAAYKISTFSTDKRYDAMTLPKGADSVSMSGGSLTMSRSLAEALFPIDESLPSEDIWLGYAAPAVADRTIRNPSVVLEYRIHGGNSNPRQAPFAQMSQSMSARHEGWQRLATSALPLPEAAHKHLASLWQAELHRRAGATISILRTPGLKVAERASLAAMSRPGLFRIRKVFYRLLSGRQGR